MFNLRIFVVLAALFSVAGAQSETQTEASDLPITFPVTPQWAERYLFSINSPLLDDSVTDHVMSLYYFGRYGDFTLIGLERVRGDEFQQFFTLLVFKQRSLTGYYANVLSFPSQVSDNGDVSFPRGVEGRLQDTEQPFNITRPGEGPLCQSAGDKRLCVNWTSSSS